MGENGRIDWRHLGLLAVVAAVVAALVAVGVVGLRAQPQGGAVGPLGVVSPGTHFTGPLGIEKGISAGGNLTVTANIAMTDGYLVNSKGAITVNDTLLATALQSVGTSTVGTSEQVTTWESVGTYLTVGTFATVGNGLGVAGNVTMSTGSLLNSRGAVTVTDDLYVTSQAQVANGLSVGGYVTMSTGHISSSQGGVTITDDLVLGGNVSDALSMLRLSEDTVVTGTLGVSSQVNAANGVAVTGNITVAGGITATGWLRGYGAVLQPAVTMAITANYGITPGNYSLLVVSDDGGQATGTVTLSATTSIVDGTHVGQLLMILYNDTDGATMTVKDGANTKLNGNSDVVLSVDDVLVLVWDGSDWLYVMYSDN